jgi:hypothetical protein
MPVRDERFAGDTDEVLARVREFTQRWRDFPQQVFTVPTLVGSCVLLGRVQLKLAI